MLRLASPHDAGAIRAIYAPFVEQSVVSFEYEVPAVEEIEKRMSKVLERLPWLVHEQDGQITGYAYASPHRERSAYQWSVDASVYIRPDFHRRGIGRSLYTRLFDLLKTLGYYNVYAGITLPNPGSELLHRAMGFTPVGTYEKVGYKFGRWHDVQWYSLLLREHPAHPEPPLSIWQLPSGSH